MYSAHNFPGTRIEIKTYQYRMQNKNASFLVTHIGENCHSLYLNSFYGDYPNLLTLLEKLAYWAKFKAEYTNFYLTTNNSGYTTVELRKLIEKCKFIKCGRSFTNYRTKNKVSMYRVDIRTLLRTIKELK